MNKTSTLPFTVGLTGGIGSGKSAVSNLFEEMGIYVIDTDLLSRELVASGLTLLSDIENYFGTDILLPNGELDRSRLRDIIFANPEKKRWLEQLLHPQIRALLLQRLTQCQSDYALIVVPLLLESDDYKFLNRILVVDCPEALQLQRVQQRDNIDTETARSIMASQLPRDQRLAYADDIISNDSSLNDLKSQVEELHEKYKKLSRQ